jgi:hypothetical protein
MRSLRFIFIGIITFLFVTNVVFLRRTVSVLLCGVLSFNSASCYSFLDKYGKADAAAPPSSAVVTSKDFSFVEKDKQKVAGCLFGVCVNLPQIPGVTGGDPLGVAKTAIVKQIGEAVGVGSPLLLDQKTAYADVSDQVKDFHPQKLTITSAEDLQKPLPPGDYSLDVIAYCTQFSIHAPGRGLPYKLAPLMGKQAPTISALLSRGTLQGIAPATLNANAWRIQAGLPLKQWPSQDQALIHKLIPEYEKGLEGDYLQQIENTYNQFRIVPGIPSLNDLLTQSGAPGQTVLQLRQARQTLANQTISAERLPDMLYEPTGDGLPRVLPAVKDSSPSLWAEVQPGVFARFTVIEGNLGKNLFEFRVTPKAKSAAINNKSAMVATKELDKNVPVSQQTQPPATPASVVCDSTHNTYSKDRPAQALIPACVSDAKADEKEPLPESGDLITYQVRGDKYAHVAVIIEGGVKKNSDGTVTITRVRSKWGGGAVYDHDPNQTISYGTNWSVWHRNKKPNYCKAEECNWLKVEQCHSWELGLGDNCFITDKGNNIYHGGCPVKPTGILGRECNLDDATFVTSEHPLPGVDRVELPENRLAYDCRGFVFGHKWSAISEFYLGSNQIQTILDDGYIQLSAKDSQAKQH